MTCPKCGEDITDSFEEGDPSTGVAGGWWCDDCEASVAEWESDMEPMEGDVDIYSSIRPTNSPLEDLPCG